jgi:hypothetical protein
VGYGNGVEIPWEGPYNLYGPCDMGILHGNLWNRDEYNTPCNLAMIEMKMPIKFTSYP